jgi:hypothetical protein
VADDERRDVFTHPGLVRFWAASAVFDFGSYITTIALQVLVVLTLDGSAPMWGSSTLHVGCPTCCSASWWAR